MTNLRQTYTYSVFLLIIFTCLLFSSKLHGEVLLNIQSFKVAKDHPAEFLVDLKQDDKIILSLRQVGGNIDSDKAFVQVVDLNNIEEEILDEFGTSTGQSRIPYDGKYKIRVIYTGKGLTLRGWQHGLFSLKVESLKTTKQKPGEFREILQATNLAIDDDSENALKLLLNVNRGDKISISSVDPKASIIKYELLQLAKTGFVSNFTTIEADRDITLTLILYLAENNDGKSIYNISELIKRGDIQVEDLVISLEKKPKMLTTSQNSNADPYGNNQQKSNSEPETDPYAMLMESISSSQENANEQNQNYAELIASGQMNQAEVFEKMAKAIEEMNKEKEYVIINPGDMGEIEVELGPADNLFKTSKNKPSSSRSCHELVLRSTHNQWFYWVAVGDKAEDIFEENNEKYYKSTGQTKTLTKAKAEYIYYMQDPTKRLSDPDFPTEVMYPDAFVEDVEYAVVDEFNRTRFLKGQRYNKLNYRPKQFVTVDQGFTFTPFSTDEIYHVCFSNNNKRTPIKVYFRYFTINAEKEMR